VFWTKSFGCVEFVGNARRQRKGVLMDGGKGVGESAIVS